MARINMHRLLLLFTSCCSVPGSSAWVYRQTLYMASKDQVGPEKKTSSLPRLYVGPSSFLQRDGGVDEHHSFGNNQVKLSPGARVTLNADQAHYLTKVLRLKLVGRDDYAPEIRVFDGEHGEWLAQVKRSNVIQEDTLANTKKRRRQRSAKNNQDFFAECTDQIRSQEECITSCDGGAPLVIFAPIKKTRAKLMVEKCTELGAAAFIPIVTDRTEKGNVMALTSYTGLDKLSMQALEASEQCERLFIPQVLPNPSVSRDVTSEEENSCWTLEDLLERWECGITAKRKLLVCRERGAGKGTTPILDALDDVSHDGRTIVSAFLIGPEGGWSPEEELLLDDEERYPFIRSVSLGDLVLRAETAAMMAVGAWSLSRKQ